MRRKPSCVGPSVVCQDIFNPLEGLTPLHVAILSRSWETAKVIIAIAMAQYEAPAHAITNDYGSGELLACAPLHFSFCLPDSCSEVSVMEVDDDIADELNRKAEIIDISHRFSTVRVPLPPSNLFRAAPHLSKGSVSYWTPVAAAVHGGDVEAAKRIFALHELCVPPLPVNPQEELDNVLRSDSPAMLDLFIRKFGIGLGVSEEEEDDDPQGTEAIKKTPKTYLGLDVHGVKRKDLAKKNDPDAPRRGLKPHHIPLLWSAATTGATKIIDWLTTPAPLEAYKAFKSSASVENAIAKTLNKINDMEAQLPELLGFLPNELGETAVFAALCGKQEKRYAIVKQLYKNFPHMKNTFTASRVKGVELTPILLVCVNKCDKDLSANNRDKDLCTNKELFDFFLSHGANPMDVDHNGYVVLI